MWNSNVYIICAAKHYYEGTGRRKIAEGSEIRKGTQLYNNKLLLLHK